MSVFNNCDNNTSVIKGGCCHVDGEFFVVGWLCFWRCLRKPHISHRFKPLDAPLTLNRHTISVFTCAAARQDTEVHRRRRRISPRTVETGSCLQEP